MEVHNRTIRDVAHTYNAITQEAAKRGCRIRLKHDGKGNIGRITKGKEVLFETRREFALQFVNVAYIIYDIDAYFRRVDNYGYGI